MRVPGALLCLILIFRAPIATADPPPISLDIESPVIEITASFAGTQELLFGAVVDEGDVIVVVSGPLRPEVVRRKARIAGIWINADRRTFETVPAYYHVGSTRSLRDILSEALLERHQIGAEHVRFGYSPEQKASEREIYRAALIRNKRREGLYGDAPVPITVRDGRLFRATFTFPANVATGSYTADVYFVRDGAIVGSQSRSLTITKAGIEASIFNFAHQHAALYGIIAIAIALIAGWLAGVIFRKA